MPLIDCAQHASEFAAMMPCTPSTGMTHLRVLARWGTPAATVELRVFAAGMRLMHTICFPRAYTLDSFGRPVGCKTAARVEHLDVSSALLNYDALYSA